MIKITRDGNGFKVRLGEVGVIPTITVTANSTVEINHVVNHYYNTHPWQHMDTNHGCPLCRMMMIEDRRREPA
jgi:hypothetical protein